MEKLQRRIFFLADSRLFVFNQNSVYENQSPSESWSVGRFPVINKGMNRALPEVQCAMNNTSVLQIGAGANHRAG